MAKVLIAKSNKEDIALTERFLEVSEFLLTGGRIESLDINDPIRVLYNKIVWDADFIVDPKASDVEIRYQILQYVFTGCTGRWMKVINTASVMESEICDPDKSYLAFRPEIARELESLMMGE